MEVHSKNSYIIRFSRNDGKNSIIFFNLKINILMFKNKESLQDARIISFLDEKVYVYWIENGQIWGKKIPIIDIRCLIRNRKNKIMDSNLLSSLVFDQTKNNFGNKKKCQTNFLIAMSILFFRLIIIRSFKCFVRLISNDWRTIINLYATLIHVFFIREFYHNLNDEILIN